MEKVLILDGNSLANRAFYAIPDLTTVDGRHTNALYGFANMLFKMKEDINPTYIFATFDKKAPTFRHLQYKDYKAGRKQMPSELSEQFPRIKDMLSLMDIKICELEGFEADDLIGTIAKKSEAEGLEVYIVTGDRDALQLASNNIKIVITKKGVSETAIYDQNRMLEEMGVTPTQFIDVKGLMGDKSDNIPGVPGIGEKTAYKLIQTYGSVEAVLSNIDEISGNKIKENLREYSMQAIDSKRLATIITEVPMEFNIEEGLMKECNNNELKKFFLEYQMKSLVSKLPEEEVEKQERDNSYILVEDMGSLKKMFDSINNTVFISYDIRDKQRYSTIEIGEMYLSSNENTYMVKFDELIKNNECSSLLKQYFENDKLSKVVHDCKDFITVLSKYDIEFNGIIFDTTIGAYLINSAKSDYNLINLINDYLGEDLKETEENLSIIQNKLMSKLYLILDEKIKEAKMEELLYNVELPLCKVLSSMESVGIKINKEKLDELEVNFKSEIDRTQKEIYELSEEEFNINSPKQLGKILFEKLDLPVVKKTKTGYSTNAEVLEKLLDKHPIIEKIIYFRQIAKIYSTYVEGLKQVIDADGCIHSSFNQTVTTTGRLSSTEPNLQNIPIKYEMGREIRKVFIPLEKDDIILSADYSQIELRVLAHMAGDENMIDAFKHNVDIHTKTASEVFKTPIEEVTSLMRSRAKAVNFGIVYGISDFSLAQDLNIPKKEAKEYIEIYFDRYPKIKNYLESVITQAKEKAYVLTLLNRRRFIPEITSSNKIVKALGERLAMNAPIQGSAADIIKLAMVNVHNKLKEGNFKSEVLLQVHDELILNVKKDELEAIKKLVKQEMEGAVELHVPLEVDINLGSTWYEAK